jgi:hypothetical protein
MVNAHPVILRHLCKNIKLETPYLEEYINRRDEIIAETGLSRDDAKKLYLMMMNADDIDIKVSTDYMNGFKAEMKMIHNRFYELNKDEADLHIRNRQLKGKTENMRASYVNILMCKLENDLLMSIHKYYDSPTDCVLCFDGIMLRKEKRKSLNYCMKYLKKIHGLDITLKIKDMDEVLDLSKYKEPSQMDLVDNRVYTHCKELPVFNKIPSHKFTREFISPELDDSYYNNITSNLVLKSDTGTGKTSSFSSYIKKQGYNFISIGSRISLLDQQYKDFESDDIQCTHYNMHQGKFKQNDSVLVMLDSIHRIRHIDVSDYVIYMDEFAFLVDYLLTSDTLNDKRIICMRILMELIRDCKQFICTDADIGLTCLEFLDKLNVKYDYHLNEYKKCNNVKASELNSRLELLNHLKKQKKFLVCTDSKTEADSLSKDLNDSSVVNITSEYKGVIDLEKHEKVIISPKVITGVDSKMARPVYAVYKEHTITSKHMMQQINRCRNIEAIYYVFPSKAIRSPRYETIDDVIEEIDEQDSLYAFDVLATKEESRIYKTLYTMCLYERDCIQTNKFLHFKKIMRSRGVDDPDKFINNKEKLVTRREIIKEKIENLDVEKLKAKVDDEGYIHPAESNEINEILQIPDSELSNYKEYLVDDILLSTHFQMAQYFFKKNEKEKLNDSNEFNSRKSTSVKGRMMTLRKLCDTYGIELSSDKNITVTKNQKKAVNEQMIKLYTTSFRYRGKPLNFTNPDSIIKLIVSSTKLLFGNDIIKTTRKQIGKTRSYTYQIDKTVYDRHYKLYGFRNPELIDEPCENDINTDRFKKSLFHK